IGRRRPQESRTWNVRLEHSTFFNINDGKLIFWRTFEMFRLIASALLLIGLAGCSGEGKAESLPETQQVTGTVTLNGKPLAGAMVRFVPNGTTTGVECTGVTDTNGVYIPQQER